MTHRNLLLYLVSNAIIIGGQNMAKITFGLEAKAILAMVATNTKATPERPVNGNVLFEVNENTIKLRSYKDVELTAIVSPISSTSTDLEFTVPGDLLKSVLPLINEETNLVLDVGRVTKTRKRSVTMTVGESTYKTESVDPHTIMRLPNFNTQESVTVSKSELVECIKGVKTVAPKQDTRSYLNSVNLKIDNGFLTAIASDGHRLGYVKRELSAGDKTKQKDVLLPIGSVDAFLEFLKPLDEVQMEFSDSHLRVQSQGLTLSLQLLDFKYPNVDELTTTNSSKSFSISSEAFKSSLDKVGIVRNSMFPTVRLDFKGNLIELESKAVDTQMAKDVLHCDVGINDVEIAFNIDYLKTALSNLSVENVKVFIVKDRFIIIPVGKEDMHDVQVLASCNI